MIESNLNDYKNYTVYDLLKNSKKELNIKINSNRNYIFEVLEIF